MTKRSSIVASSKEAEREVARVLGGTRLHAGEWKGKKGDVDVEGPFWVAQVKHRAGVPAYITEGMKQLDEAVTDKMKLLVLVTKPGRGKKAQMFVMLQAEDFARLDEILAWK